MHSEIKKKITHSIFTLHTIILLFCNRIPSSPKNRIVAGSLWQFFNSERVCKLVLKNIMKCSKGCHMNSWNIRFLPGHRQLQMYSFPLIDSILPSMKVPAKTISYKPLKWILVSYIELLLEKSYNYSCSNESQSWTYDRRDRKMKEREGPPTFLALSYYTQFFT